MARNRTPSRSSRRRASIAQQLAIPAYLKQVRRTIRVNGHSVQAVLPNPGEVAWSYTVGLHRKGLPELIVSGGLSLPGQHELLNEIAYRMHAGEVFEHGQREPGLIVGFDVMFVEVANTATDDFAVANRLQSDFRALQVVWPDHDDRFPWEDGYDVPIEEQRLLGLPPS